MAESLWDPCVQLPNRLLDFGVALKINHAAHGLFRQFAQSLPRRLARLRLFGRKERCDNGVANAPQPPEILIYRLQMLLQLRIGNQVARIQNPLAVLANPSEARAYSVLKESSAARRSCPNGTR